MSFQQRHFVSAKPHCIVLAPVGPWEVTPGTKGNLLRWLDKACPQAASRALGEETLTESDGVTRGRWGSPNTWKKNDWMLGESITPLVNSRQDKREDKRERGIWSYREGQRKTQGRRKREILVAPPFLSLLSIPRNAVWTHLCVVTVNVPFFSRWISVSYHHQPQTQTEERSLPWPPGQTAGWTQQGEEPRV